MEDIIITEYRISQKDEAGSTEQGQGVRRMIQRLREGGFPGSGVCENPNLWRVSLLLSTPKEGGGNSKWKCGIQMGNVPVMSITLI